MPFSYAGDPAASDVDAVRFEAADTNPAAPLLQDAEVAWCILSETGAAAQTPAVLTGGLLYAAAARACETLARGLAFQADTMVGSLSTTYSKQAANYAQRAKELRAKASGFHAPYAGGQSQAEKQAAAQDPDRVAPLFARRQWDSPWAGELSALAREDLGPPFGD